MTSAEQRSDSSADREKPGSIAIFLETHGIPVSTAKSMAVTIGSILLVFLVAGVFLWRRSHATRLDEEATRELFSARAQTKANLDTLMERCSSSKLAPLIMLKQAQVQYAEGNYDPANAAYERFLKEYPTHELAPVAEFGQLLCREARMNKDDLDSALKGFAGFAAKHPDSFLVNEATFGRARCMEELGRLEEARQVYEDFKVAHPSENIWQERAETSLKIVEAELRRKKNTP